MTRPILAITAALVLASCATQKFGDAIIYGHTRDVTEADIRAALAARRTGGREGHVYEIEVQSRDTIRLHLHPRNTGGYFCAVIERVKGKWHDEGASWSEVLPES
jgi:hypothetical protein